jgi:acetyltransferase-like isoleucine patch superfamily enzyme
VLLLNLLRGLRNRTLQLFARNVPGATNLRVWLNRWRGVKIGSNVWIGYDAIIETESPELVTIEDGASLGIRCTIIAHMRERHGVVIGADAQIGPGTLVLAGVTIGAGTVVAAGSVVTQSLPPMVLAQGNPAKPVARIGLPLRMDVTLKQFMKHLKPLKS